MTRGDPGIPPSRICSKTGMSWLWLSHKYVREYALSSIVAGADIVTGKHRDWETS